MGVGMVLDMREDRVEILDRFEETGIERGIIRSGKVVGMQGRGRVVGVGMMGRDRVMIGRVWFLEGRGTRRGRNL